MVSSNTIFSAVFALAVVVHNANAHGYMYIPLAEFTNSVTSAWIMQIEPQCDIRTLLDSDTDLYGADCGYTDPDATAKDPPTTGDATFSRGMVPVRSGWMTPWCCPMTTAYGDGTQDTKSVFTPVDYSLCSTSGCMLRFYWLAFQGVDSDMVWQVYKDCVSLTGPVSGDNSFVSTTASTSSTTANEAGTSTTVSSSTPDVSSSATATTPSATTKTSTTGGNLWTSTGSTATTSSVDLWSYDNSSTIAWTSGSKGKHYGSGKGWSGGFGGMGGGLRQ
ncbi:hypothetical protein PInf_011649 [Phytophthora infestans]|nr:hypothetical protein PInf_011649 [Phytophthora infestans]